MSQIFSVFLTVFLAELGDKTQLATLFFATDKSVKTWHVFLASSCALVLSTAIASLLGHYIAQSSIKLPLKLFAGIGFIVIGALSLWDHFKG